MGLEKDIFVAVLLVLGVLGVRFLLIYFESLRQIDNRFWYLKMLTLVVTVLSIIIFIDAFGGNFFNTVFIGASGIYFVFKGEALGRNLTPEVEGDIDD
jgi:hypothetical protein